MRRPPGNRRRYVLRIWAAELKRSARWARPVRSPWWSPNRPSHTPVGWRSGSFVTAPEACAFCRLLETEFRETWVLETEASVAFLDHRPLFHGHCLVVPRAHFETLSDLPSDLIPALFADVQLLSRAVEEAMDADGSFIAINNRVSQSVRHLHVHVVPRRKRDGLRGFFWPRKQYEQNQQRAIATSIRDAVARQNGA